MESTSEFTDLNSNILFQWFQSETRTTLFICTIEKNRSYTSLSWDYYKRPIVIFWFRMYWCSSRQERETGIEKNQKNFSHTLLIKQWHAPILSKPKFLLLIRKRECQAREKFLLFFSMYVLCGQMLNLKDTYLMNFRWILKLV